MAESRPHALGTSLLLTRLGQAATTPLTEQELVDRLQGAAHRAGYAERDLVTAIYVGLKAAWHVALIGPAREQSMRLLTAITTTLVGADSQQTLHLHGPIGGDAMAQRFAALRIGDFVALALEPMARSRAWFIVIDTPGDATATVQWVKREVRATINALGLPDRWPAPLSLLVAAGTVPALPLPGWLALGAPCGSTAPGDLDATPLPPVGYQRLLLETRLTGRAYRARIEQYGDLITPLIAATQPRRFHRLVRRWCVASVDDHGRGLWHGAGAAANFHTAVRALAQWQRF